MAETLDWRGFPAISTRIGSLSIFAFVFPRVFRLISDINNYISCENDRLLPCPKRLLPHLSPPRNAAFAAASIRCSLRPWASFAAVSSRWLADAATLGADAPRTMPINIARFISAIPTRAKLPFSTSRRTWSRPCAAGQEISRLLPPFLRNSASRDGDG